MRTTTADCFTPKQKEFFTAYVAYQDASTEYHNFIKQNPMPRLGYPPFSRQEAEFNAHCDRLRPHYVRMDQLSMEDGKCNLKSALDAACYTHNIKRFDFNNEEHRQLIIPSIVSHNAPEYLHHLSTKDYERVIKKRLKIAHTTAKLHEGSEGYVETALVTAATKHHALHAVHAVIKNFFTEKPKKITEADVLAHPEYWETDESVLLSKEHFDEVAKARVLAIKTQSIERNMRALSGNVQQTSTEVAHPSQAIPTQPTTLQNPQQSIATATSQTSSALSDEFSETLMTLIGETASIDGFEREEKVTALYAALHSQIENKASPSDIISTKAQLDLEKTKIFNERKQFDKAIHEVGHTVNIASSLSIIFGNDRLAGQIASAGHSVLTIGNAFAGIAGIGLLAAASPLELGSTLLSGIAGLVGLFRQADSGPNLAEILMPMLHAISQQLSQLRVEMHERFDEVMNTLNNMQRILLNGFMELSREAKLTQEMVLAVIARIDHLQERQDAGFLRMNERFDQLELQIEYAEARRAWKEIVALKPIAQVQDTANYNVNMKRLLSGYDAMAAYDPLLTGKSFNLVKANDLQMPTFMLAQTLASAAQIHSPVGNPFAILHTTTLLGRFIEVHHKTARDTFEGMTKEDVALLQLIDEKHIQPLRRLIIALRQMMTWDYLLRGCEQNATQFKMTCENHLQNAIKLYAETEGLRLRSDFLTMQLQRHNDRDIFMRQEIPIGLDCYPWQVEYFALAGMSSDDWRKDTHVSNMYLQKVQKEYRDALHKEVEKIKQNHLSDHVFMYSLSRDFLLPLPSNIVDAIPAHVHYLRSRKNFKVEFVYNYDDATSKLTIMGRLFLENGLECKFFEKSFSNPLHYKGVESLWWFWMGGNVPINATMQERIIHPTGQSPMRHDHVCKYTDKTPIFSRALPLRDQIDFSQLADQVPLSDEIQRIYESSLEQELLQSDAYHKSLHLDAEDVATPLGNAFEKLNCAYLLMRRALEFLEIVSPCGIWQSNLLHELNVLLSAEKILLEARRQQVNPACLFPQKSMFVHFSETVRTEMQRQHNNGTLFFDDTLKAFFDVVEKCASTAKSGMSVQGLKEFDDAVMNGIAMMIAEMSAGRMTAEQFAAFQITHFPAVQAVRSGQMAVTPALMESLRTPQITAPPVVSSATLFQPAAPTPPVHTGSVPASSAAPI